MFCCKRQRKFPNENFPLPLPPVSPFTVSPIAKCQKETTFVTIKFCTIFRSSCSHSERMGKFNCYKLKFTIPQIGHWMWFNFQGNWTIRTTWIPNNRSVNSDQFSSPQTPPGRQAIFQIPGNQTFSRSLLNSPSVPLAALTLKINFQSLTRPRHYTHHHFTPQSARLCTTLHRTAFSMWSCLTVNANVLHVHSTYLSTHSHATPPYSMHRSMQNSSSSNTTARKTTRRTLHSRHTTNCSLLCLLLLYPTAGNWTPWLDS